jgi:lipopolysaccharide transport system ATP-binding protein
MRDIAIQVEGLSKQYHIGRQQAKYDTIREAISRSLFSPFRKAGRLVRGQASAAAGLDETIWALRDISFEVEHGEVLGIIGRNGAGKSTLLKILSRITEPTEGYADVYGRIGSLLEVGTGFHPELTGRENIFLNGAVLGMKRVEISHKFDEIVAFAEVEKFVDTPVKHYSSGMYLRLAFAVAAHLEPEILVVDEVLAVGDAAFQKKCMGKMGEVAQQGRTVLFVSHNMEAIQRLCDKCILLDWGQLIEHANTGQVVEKYLSSGRQLEAGANLFEVPRQPNLGVYARVKQCIIYDSEGTSTNTFAFGEPFSVEVICQGLKPIEDVSFLVGIDSVYEQRVVTITSLETNELFAVESGEIVCGSLGIKGLFLKPGAYSLTLGLFSANKGIDHVPQAVRFQISDVSFTQEHMHVSQITVGMIQMADPYWKVHSEPISQVSQG